MILEEALVHELPPEITDAVWRWSKTQYRDDQWIEPNIRTYFLKLTQKKDLDIQISCKELNGEYQVANNLLSITVKESQFNRVPCDDQAMDNTYLSDLARVVHYFIDDDRLVLVLDNNAGYMYFSNKP